jgi:predicted GTPase
MNNQKINQTKNLKINRKYILLDSAGIRKPGSRTTGAESFATLHTIEAANKADVICLVVDGSAPLTHQDQVVAGICKEAKKGVVVIANKADLVDKMGRKVFEESFYKKFGFLKVQKFLWVSAKAEIIKSIDKNNADLTSNLSTENPETFNQFSNQSENLMPENTGNKQELTYTTELKLENPEKADKYALKKAQKEARKANLIVQNIAKMQEKFAKDLPTESLGEFKPENGLASIWRSIDEALDSRQKDIDPEQVRKLFNYLMKHKDKRPVKLQSEKKPIVYDLLYTKNSPPTFELLVKDKSAIHWSYLRFLENVVRKQFGLKNTGVVIKMVEVKKSKVMG